MAIIEGIKELYKKEANYHFRYEDAESLLANPADLINLINEHKNVQRTRLEVLDDYYKAKNTTMKNYVRAGEYNDANLKIFHNFGKVITQFKVGYTTNNPIRLKYPEEKVSEKLNEIDKMSDMPSHNAELMLDISKYGRGYELVYEEDGIFKVILLNTFETFVVYDYDIEKNPILGVRYVNYPKQGDNPEETRISVYTAEEVIEYRLNGETLEEIKTNKHLFGGVPIIEYQNNRFRLGDYEDLLSVIDAYDLSESNTANHLNDLVNSVLVIQGDIRSLKDNEEYRKMYNNKVIFAKSGLDADGKPTEVDAKYIYRNLDVQALETYKTRIRKDIFSLSNVPDLTDESFSGNKSGEAMKYKLFGFQQSVSATMSNFKKAAKMRYQLLLNAKGTKSGLLEIIQSKVFNQSITRTDLSELEILFKPNIPISVIDEMKMLVDSGTTVSTLTKLGLVSFIDDPQSELERIEHEENSSEGNKLAGYLKNNGDAHGHE
ncbi:phage portal protein [Carnobacterium divergens]|uniref:phage portal protein n=1 Tax=Carnobacterium divergens TaxID=2748 RepID=UPI00288D3C32|nr:phage portal protein [Carnobacterium divergens]MDT1996847.1 phage portal protein [Carnobacterium divergens]